MDTPELVARYQSKTDEELLELAQSRGQLTAEASAILMGELSRRQIQAIEVGPPQKESRRHDSEKPDAWNVSEPHGQSVGPFMEEVLHTYRDHFWFFVKLMCPAIVIGYVAIFASRSAIREIIFQAQIGLAMSNHRLELVEVVVLRFSGFAVSWIALCVAFSAISSGVRQIGDGLVPSVRQAYAEVRECKGPLFRLSLLLFFLVGISQFAAVLLGMGIHWLSQVLHTPLTAFNAFVATYICAFLALLGFSRFALSIPALVLDNCKVGQSVFRSDELTERKWLTLGLILVKSIVLGYVAGMFPYWIAPWIPSTIPLPNWFPWVLSAASIAGVSVVEPLMFIGFALLYTKTSKLSLLSDKTIVTAHYPASIA